MNELDFDRLRSERLQDFLRYQRRHVRYTTGSVLVLSAWVCSLFTPPGFDYHEVPLWIHRILGCWYLPVSLGLAYFASSLSLSHRECRERLGRDKFAPGVMVRPIAWSHLAWGELALLICLAAYWGAVVVGLI
ncbi:MAG: hypothetical protein KKA42_07880 [candidate division Zixibacteria bacterium]|nr:hypothetical protein [candidate division Zixibacteria bacterium]